MEIIDIAAAVRENTNQWEPGQVHDRAVEMVAMAEAAPYDHRRAIVAATLIDVLGELEVTEPSTFTDDDVGLHARLRARVDALGPIPDPVPSVVDPTGDLRPDSRSTEIQGAELAEWMAGAGERHARREAARRQARNRVLHRGAKDMQEEIVQLDSVSAEDLASAATDAFDLYLAAEFADEDIPVVGWVEDTYSDHVAVGVGVYGDDGSPTVEFWDIPIEWFDTDEGVMAEIDAEPVLIEVAGVSVDPNLGKCLSAPEIVAAGLAAKVQLQARRRMAMLEPEPGQKGLVDEQSRYDVETKADWDEERPSLAAQVTWRRTKRGARDEVTVDAYAGAMTKAACDLLAEIQSFAVSGTEPDSKALLDAHRALGVILDEVKDEVKDDDSVWIDPEILAYAAERGIDLFATPEPEPEVKDEVDEVEEKRKFTAEQRRELAARGQAKPDGSYPIENRSDLVNAVQAYRGDPSDKAWIIKRARALNALSALPDEWDVSD